MKQTHSFAGRATLASGLLLLLFFLAGRAGLDFVPDLIQNWTFAVFGLSLAVFAFTYRRWRPEDDATDIAPK